MSKHLIQKYLKYLSLAIIVLVIGGCSTKKNTGFRRAYHGLTSRYNILFNGEESYKKGMQLMEDNVNYNFLETLPVFLYTDRQLCQSIESEMDRSIRKATKLISQHSITVKPKVNPNREMSEKEREFYNKREFNKWVDEAYLLMGKAHFYKYEYEKANETFNYILSIFPDEPAVFESKLWMARLAIQNQRYKEAEDWLTALDKDISFPKHLQAELKATWADFYLRQEVFEDAIEPLIFAKQEIKGKQKKARYSYILAQIYQKLDRLTEASNVYAEVIKLNPPYEMTFNAKIQRALNFQAGGSSKNEILKQLNKMLKDDKNIDYFDKVYYALGNISLKEGDLDQALEYYLLSSQSSKGNINQQALTFLTVADIYYDRAEYIAAQAYYDSTVNIIEPDYANYALIYAKSVSLTNLVNNVNTFELEDSLQALAALPDPELMARIDRIIEEYEEEEERKKLEEEQAEQALLAETQVGGVNSFISDKTLGGWYFSNPNMVNLGKQDFRKKWGNRQLEDHWRRRNKNVVSFEQFALEEEIDADGNTVTKERLTNKKTREFYLQDIPKSDSMMQASHSKIQEALFNMGDIYSRELKDFDKAIYSYEELIRRYPQYKDRLQVYYRLFSIGSETENQSLENKYKGLIISGFPTSNYAQLMTNPNYVKEMEQKAQKIFNTYDRAYTSFSQQRHAEVIALSQKAMVEYPEHELVPKFDYLHTVSSGVTKDTLEFIADLKNLMARHPGDEIGRNAQILIDFLQNTNPKVAEIEKLRVSEDLYTEDMEDLHLFVISLPARQNLNQLIFNVINFNLDHYPEQPLNVKKGNVGNAVNLCVVDKFENAGLAMEYLNKIGAYPELWKDVPMQGSQLMVISEKNYAALLKQNSIGSYLIYYRKHYR